MPPPNLPIGASLDWQAAYARELLRTSGQTVVFQELGGGWYRMFLGGDKIVFGKQRRKNVERMTEALKARPDYQETSGGAEKS